jgi:hypothetical protein
MDGNRTHPGRLNSAPQTVLKTAFLKSMGVGDRPHQMVIHASESADVRCRLPMSNRMAVSWLSQLWRPGRAVAKTDAEPFSYLSATSSDNIIINGSES